MEENLGSDDVRHILLEEGVDYDEDWCSDHNSDVDSNVGEQLENEYREELGNDYQSFGNGEEDQYSYELEIDNNAEGVQNMEEETDGMSQEEIDQHEEEVESCSMNWRDWKTGDTKFNKFEWIGNSGYKPPQGESPQTPLQFFQLFFSDQLLSEIVKETNRYASEKIQSCTPLQKKSMWWTWTDITMSELKAFIGVLLNMGINGKPELNDYFSNDWVDYQPFFKEVFSKERFLQILWTLHVSPPPSGPIAGTLTRSGKIRNVVTYLDKKFREFYVPHNKVSVDESTVGFKGRAHFKVYNKEKPNKWGIKVFVLSDPSSGYICAMEPYLGKTTTNRMARHDLGVTSRIVLHLVSKLQETYQSLEGLHVFTDRFYTSLDLAEALLQMKIHLTGTILTNRRGLPDEVRPSKNKKGDLSNTIGSKKSTNKTTKLKLKKGEIKCYRKEDKYSLLLWQDSRLVVTLSTLYDNTTQTVRRLKKRGLVEDVKKPTVICKYNKSMGGVDLSDQFISSYSFTRKSLKWWKKVFFWLVETAVVNSFILYNSNQGDKKVRQRKFRKLLINELVGSVRNSKKRGRPSSAEEEERLNGKLHLPYPLEVGKTKDCVACSDRRAGKERKRSKFYCKTCSNNPGLHMGACFEKYHSLKNIKD